MTLDILEGSMGLGITMFGNSPDISYISWPAWQDSVSKGDRSGNRIPKTDTRNPGGKAILN